MSSSTLTSSSFSEEDFHQSIINALTHPTVTFEWGEFSELCYSGTAYTHPRVLLISSEAANKRIWVAKAITDPEEGGYVGYILDYCELEAGSLTPCLDRPFKVKETVTLNPAKHSVIEILRPHFLLEDM